MGFWQLSTYFLLALLTSPLSPLISCLLLSPDTLVWEFDRCLLRVLSNKEIHSFVQHLLISKTSSKSLFPDAYLVRNSLFHHIPFLALFG